MSVLPMLPNHLSQTPLLLLHASPYLDSMTTSSIVLNSQIQRGLITTFLLNFHCLTSPDSLSLVKHPFRRRPWTPCTGRCPAK